MSFTMPRVVRRGLVLSPASRLEDAVEAMQRAGVQQATVFDGDRLLGGISREDIRRFRARRAPGAPAATVLQAMPRVLDSGYDLDHDRPLLVERGDD